MSSHLTNLIELEIAKSWHRPFSRELRRLYDTRREAARRVHAATAIGLLCIFYATCIGLDFILIPDVWKLSLLNRLVITPIIGGTAFAYCRRGPCEIIELRNAIAIVIAASLWAIQLTATNNHIGALAYLSLSPMLIIAANIFCSLPLLIAATTSLIIFLMMSWIMIVNIDPEHYFTIGSVSSIVWIAMLTLFVNWRSDRIDFRVFLHQIKLEIQQELIEAKTADFERLSSTDALTGLQNRRSFDATLTTCWSDWTSSETSFALMLLDVDFFKRYNDGYGHLAGDKCLIAMANAMQAVVTAHDGYIGRFGGEEFVVLVQSKSATDVLAIANSIRHAVRSLALRHEHRPDATTIVTISVGIASSDDSGASDPETVIRRADQTLYRAKEAGRDQLFMFEPETAEARLGKSDTEVGPSESWTPDPRISRAHTPRIGMRAC